jgi:hypothetical protein
MLWALLKCLVMYDVMYGGKGLYAHTMTSKESYRVKTLTYKFD